MVNMWRIVHTLADGAPQLLAPLRSVLTSSDAYSPRGMGPLKGLVSLLLRPQLVENSDGRGQLAPRQSEIAPPE